MSDPKGSARRGNLLECGCIRNHNLSDPKGSARRGNLLECGCIRNHNLSDPKGSARRGNLLECGCIRNHNLSDPKGSATYLLIHITTGYLISTSLNIFNKIKIMYIGIAFIFFFFFSCNIHGGFSRICFART